MTFLLRMITAAVLFFSLAAAAPAAVVQADSVRVLPISGDIDGSQAAFIQRGLRQAAEEGDTAVVITINTLGGRVDSALKIRDMLMASDVPTIAYVTSRAWSAGALIALSCRHIIMAPGSSIGAAEPIPNTEKNIAALKAEFSATAAQNGHNPGVAEAMVDKSQGYPDYAEPGKILALSDGQARELNVSDGSADTLSEALALYSLGDARLTYVDKDWRDDAVGILQNPYVRTVFVALIIAVMAIWGFNFVVIRVGLGSMPPLLLGALRFSVAALPVVIHMLTEYPVRQSTPHWLLLILLLRCADSDRAGIRLVLTSTWLIRAPGVISLLTVAPLLLLTLHTQQQLTLAERQSSQWHLAESLPVGGWLLTSRYRFDVQMGYLQRYQRTRDARWLEAVRRWAPDYVRVHPDPNVSFTQILLALQQRDLVEAHRLATRFCLIYPNDRRIPWLQDARRPFNKILE